MKYAIFCLLTFCVFQKVFTNKLEELKNLRQKALQNIKDVDNRIHLDLMGAGDVALRKGVSLERLQNCWPERFDWDFEDVQPQVEQCEECHAKALKYMNVEFARRCCMDIIATLERKAKLHMDTYTECISKLIEEMKVATKKGPRRGKKNNKVQL